MHARLEPMLIYLNLISATFSNAIPSEVPGPIGFKFDVRHHGEGYGNYADSANFPFLLFKRKNQSIIQMLSPLNLWTD